MSEPIEAWAFIDADGKALADSTFETAETAWRVGLGWPTRGEVEHAKAQGCRVVRVQIRIIEAEVAQ
jgi:hypothetical protein